MRYHVVAADYDGTLAHHGKITEATWAALRRLRDSGRKLVMVTGRELDELLALVDERVDVFERIVAENGAVIYNPTRKEIALAGAPPPSTFVNELRRLGVMPAVGRVIVSTWEPHEDDVLHAIHGLGLELQVIFNKGAVMVLPTGINKATGLASALAAIGLSNHNAVGIGDAENDHALLDHCECGVAVANALPSLKQRADWVTVGDHGTGVAELVDRLLADDLADVAPRRHWITLGTADDHPISVDPYAATIMVCGTSGSGKSSLTQGLLERFASHGYQFAIVDPEGDYTSLDIAVTLGSAQRPPLLAEVMDVLRRPHDNVDVDLLGLSVEHRPELCAQLIPALADLRARTGRPHWLVFDEAHHVLPASWTPARELPLWPHGTLYITVHPGSVAAAILETIDTLVVVGENIIQTVREFCSVAGRAPPATLPATGKLPTGHALYWKVGRPEMQLVKLERARVERTRHERKYMEGNLGRARSFYFRGREGRLNLKAQNLALFLQLADGVDEETWQFHSDNHDYSRWLRFQVKDESLADEVERLEAARAGREAVRAAIEKRYTAPADKMTGMIVDEEPPSPGA